MTEIEKLLDQMEPQNALTAIASVANRLFAHLSDKERLDFVESLIGDSGTDKISSMVSLGLAECMGEGVDPTQMCQSLVDKVAQSRQLLAIADPDILILFEDWLEELEAETRLIMQETNIKSEKELAAKLGVSPRGVKFLLTKIAKSAPGGAKRSQAL